MAPVKETLDYYAILNISQLASVQEIKKAYHRLALLHHPDKNQGSVSAAETFKKIVAAYETLGDKNKRILYDATYTKSTAKPSTSWSNPQPAPTTSTHDQYKEREKRRQEEQESEKVRQEYCRWIGLHQWHIDRAEKKVEKIRSEIDALDVKDKIAQDKLAQTQSWFTPWTWSAPVVSEEERQSMERERLNRNAARTVKQGRLHEAERELKTLKDEKNKRESAESNRMKEEQYKKDRYEQAERAKAEAQRKKEQEERFRQQREAQEKATREYMERLRKAREAQERAAQAARAAREEKKRKEEERVKQEEERMKRQAELQRKEWERIERTFADAIHQQSRSAKVENERRRKPQNTQRTQRNKTHGKSDYKQFNAYEADMHTSSPYICMHKRYWGKQNGRHQCLHCKEIQPKFAFRCPGCNTIACHTCMSKLKRGEMTTPADEYKYEDMPEDYWD